MVHIQPDESRVQPDVALTIYEACEVAMCFKFKSSFTKNSAT